jgi:ssRNA-specific RNase YbeY (16S rRNA maturation enzyme)
MAMAHQAAPKGVRVSVTDGAGRPRHLPGLSDWLRAVAPARACGAVSIALVGDAAMRRLNRRFAGKDRATDVLSFPSDAVEGVLGDIAIATGLARRQARGPVTPTQRNSASWRFTGCCTCSGTTTTGTTG